MAVHTKYWEISLIIYVCAYELVSRNELQYLLVSTLSQSMNANSNNND